MAQRDAAETRRDRVTGFTPKYACFIFASQYLHNTVGRWVLLKITLLLGLHRTSPQDRSRGHGSRIDHKRYACTQKVFYAMLDAAISSFSVCSKTAQGTTSIHGNEKKKANCNEKKKANCRKTCKLLGKNDRPVYLADAARTRFHAFRPRRHNFFSNRVSTFSISWSVLIRSIAIKIFFQCVRFRSGRSPSVPHRHFCLRR